MPEPTQQPGEWPDGSVYHYELRWAWPRVNTYRAANWRWRLALNRYPGCVIGIAMQFGHRVVGLRWGRPGRAYMVRPPSRHWRCACHPNLRWAPNRLGIIHGVTAWDVSVPDAPTVHAEFSGLAHARVTHPSLAPTTAGGDRHA